MILSRFPDKTDFINTLAQTHNVAELQECKNKAENVEAALQPALAIPDHCHHHERTSHEGGHH